MRLQARGCSLVAAVVVGLALATGIHAQLPDTSRPDTLLWPKPQQFYWTGNNLFVTKSFSFQATGVDSPALDAAFKR